MQQTLPQMVFSRIKRFDKQTVMRRKRHGSYRDISWQQLGQQVQAFAEGLLALGLQPEQQAAIMAPNCPEWAYADLAIMAIGGRTVPIYHTEGHKTIAHILADAECRILFSHSVLQAEQLLNDRQRLPLLKTIVLLEGHSEAPEILSLTDFLSLRNSSELQPFEELLAKGKRDELATLVYTSGTTGEPKGVMLTHSNILANVEACSQLIEMSPADQCL